MALFSRSVHEVVKESSLYYLINAFIGDYNRRTDVLARANGGGIGDPTTGQKLDAIIAMQEQFGTRLGLLETRVETIHGLVFDLASADPETIKQLAASVKAVREKLQTSVDNQQKGD